MRSRIDREWANAAECGARDRAVVSVELSAPERLSPNAPLGQTMVQVVPWRRPLSEWRCLTPRGIEIGGFPALGGGYLAANSSGGIGGLPQVLEKTMSP